MKFSNFVKIIKLWLGAILPPASTDEYRNHWQYFDEFCVDTNFKPSDKNSPFFSYIITYYKYSDWLSHKHPDIQNLSLLDFEIQFDDYFRLR